MQRREWEECELYDGCCGDAIGRHNRSSSPRRGAARRLRGVEAVRRRARRRGCVDLGASAGEIASIIGPNGAGKTSLLNMISGFYTPDTGSIIFEGHDITRKRPAEIAALGIARTFQNIALFVGMTVLDNIMLGRHVHMRSGVLSSLIYWGMAQKEEIAHRARCEELIEFLELQDLRKQPTAGARLRPAQAGRARRAPWRSTRSCCCSTSRWAG